MYSTQIRFFFCWYNYHTNEERYNCLTFIIHLYMYRERQADIYQERIDRLREIQCRHRNRQRDEIENLTRFVFIFRTIPHENLITHNSMCSQL